MLTPVPRELAREHMKRLIAEADQHRAKQAHR